MSRSLLVTCLLLSACSLLEKPEDDDDDGSGGGGGIWDGGSSDGGAGDGGAGDGGSGDGGAGDGGSGDGGSGDGGDDCDVTVDETRPADAENEVYIRTDVTFELSEDVAEGSITLVEAGGDRVDGSVAWTEEDTVVFTPDHPLKTETEYTATLDYCGGDPSITFRTSSLGDPLTSSVRGNSYVLDIAGATWLAPAGVGDLILSSLEQDVLVGVTAQSSSTLDLMFTTTDAGASDQDLCTPTVDLPTADFSESPFWELGPTDLSMELDGIELVLSNLTLSGTFSSDGSWYGGSVLQGEIDARIIAPLVEDLIGTDDPDSICDLVVGFGISCDPCTSDGAEYCIALHLVDVVAEEWDDTLIERTDADIRDDPACD